MKIIITEGQYKLLLEELDDKPKAEALYRGKLNLSKDKTY